MRMRYRTLALALLLALVPALRSAAAAQLWERPAAGDRLQVELWNLASDEQVSAIVQFAGRADALAYVRMERLLGSIAYRAQWTHALQGFAARLTKAQVRALRAMPGILQIEAENTYSTMMDTATRYTGVLQARADFGVDGDADGATDHYSTADVVVAVIDTGVDGTHIDLAGGKVIAFHDEVQGRTAPYDDHGHGSHVAGIIAGAGKSNAALRGVAPGAALVGIKVLDAEGSGTTTQIISGIDWMLQQKDTYHIRIANMSLGGGGCSKGTDALSAAVNTAVTSGIVMVVAAGNSGPQRCTISSPAAAAEAITVGAAYDPGELGWALAEFSSRGPTADGRVKPDIIAPGRYIKSVQANSRTGYVVMSGTSMAAPFVAGVVALMLDANPAMSDTDVKAALYHAAQEHGPPGKDREWGYGLIMAYEAIKAAGGYEGSFEALSYSGTVSDRLSATGAYKEYTIDVTSTTAPIAITLVMPEWSDRNMYNFDLALYDPSGKQVDASRTAAPQELIRYMPTRSGLWKIRVESRTGAGSYALDVSWQ